VFINYGGTHRFVAPQGFEYINICFHPEALDGQMITTDNAFGLLQLAAFDELRRENDGGMISFRGAEREEIERLLFLMQEEYRRRDAEWQTAMKSYMNVLFVRMLRKTASVGGDDEREDLWEDLLRYIEENLGEDLSLVSLAQRCFYNPSYFSRAFKDRFHMPLTEYVARRKLAHAVELVKDKGVTVTQAAVSSGFSSSGSLYRTALRWTGKRFSDLCK
jgi:AraC-like DNA-binding protein